MRKHIVENDATAPKNNPTAPKNNPSAPKNNPIAPKNNPSAPKNNPVFLHDNQCEKCEKILSRHSILIKHMKNCKGKVNPLQCLVCKEVFTLPQAKYRHQKKCKENQTIQNITNNNITNNNITNNNNCNNITINLLKFPEDGDDFQFLSDHIDSKEFKRIWDQRKPEIGFNKFIHAILDRPENRIVHKNNLNTKHSQIHIGDNKWETALDKSVYPVLMHQMSCTALEHSLEYKKNKLSLLRTDMQKILKYLDNINTENDDIDNSSKYIDAMENIEVIVYNMTKRWKTEIDKIDAEYENLE